MAPSTIDDSLSTRISPECPDPTRLLLQTAWAHDLSGLKPMLREMGRASERDPSTGETPLHAAIRSCGPAPAGAGASATTGDNDDNDDLQVSEAADMVAELFLAGAIWNDLDGHGETPGCVALRLGRRRLYDLCVEAGTRAEVLFAAMGGYEVLSSVGMAEDEDSEDGEDDEMAEDPAAEDQIPSKTTPIADNPSSTPEPAHASNAGDESTTSTQYLASTLAFSDSKLVDDAGNGVMMAWETDIMRRTVDALLPPAAPRARSPAGKRILNIGFGMGIVDGMFAATAPARHHIIEAHPAVLAQLAQPDHAFGPAWEAAAPGLDAGAAAAAGDDAAAASLPNPSTTSTKNKNDDGNDNEEEEEEEYVYVAPALHAPYHVFAGKWQDVVPTLIAAGELYDAIYFDTFGEDYAQLHLFLTEYVPALLDPEPPQIEGQAPAVSRFSFFNGLGADRRVCYDVYTRVVEIHLQEAGMDLEWQVVPVDLKALGMAEDGSGEWEGIRRRYWTLDEFRLPICTLTQ